MNRHGNIVKILIFQCFFVFLTSCTFKEYKDNSDANNDLRNVQPWFTSLNQFVIQPKCMHCHDGSRAGAPLFSTYEDVMKQVVAFHPESSQLYLSLQGVGNGDMPQNEVPLSSSAVQMIYDWIKSGAPEYGAAPPTPPPPPPKVEPTYSSIFSLVISKQCLGCHTGSASKGGGLDLSTYEAMTTNFLFQNMIVPGNPSKSDLYIMITQTDPEKRMPLGAAALQTDEISAIEAWIKNGGKETP